MTGEISAHFAEIYGTSVSKETVSRITDKVIEEMNDWAMRPLDEKRFLLVVARFAANKDAGVGEGALLQLTWTGWSGAEAARRFVASRRAKQALQAFTIYFKVRGRIPTPRRPRSPTQAI